MLLERRQDLGCHEPSDLAERSNASVERPAVGVSTDHVLCVNENAKKTFVFERCADLTTPEDVALGRVRRDCGCVVDGTTRNGVDSGIRAGTLQARCAFEPTTRTILCASAADGGP